MWVLISRIPPPPPALTVLVQVPVGLMGLQIISMVLGSHTFSVSPLVVQLIFPS